MIPFTDKIEPDKIMTLLAKSVPYYLESYNEETGLFGSTEPAVFNMNTVGTSSPVIEYVVRPHINILCVLSAYVYLGKTDMINSLVGKMNCRGEHCSSASGKTNLTDMIKKGVAWVCGCHVTGDTDVATFLARKRWGDNWRSSAWASMLGAVAVLAESVLSENERLRIREIVAHEADRFVGVSPPGGHKIDSKAEDNAQDTAVIAWAITLCPHHPHVQDWEDALKLWSVNIASSAHDGADHDEYFGSSISRMVTTCNLHPDLTAENHGYFHPDGLSYSVWLVLAMAAYKFQGREPPPYLAHKNHHRTFDILVRFCLPNGMFFAPGGHDMPLFTPHPLALAWGHWHCDPRASHMTGKLLSWIQGMGAHAPFVVDTASPAATVVPTTKDRQGNTASRAGECCSSSLLIHGLEKAHDGWTLQFQSQVGAELALLACLPRPSEHRSFSAGQVENAVDTRHIYPYVELCYRRNVRSTRSVAWKAVGGHPLVGLNLHVRPELVASFKAALLGIPSVDDPVKRTEVLFHNDRYQRDGFDTWGRIAYFGASGRRVLTRDIRVITWGEEGLVVLDKITADADLQVNEQYLSPVYIVNDHWTNNGIDFVGGSLRETINFHQKKYREINCPAFWASVENELLFQFVWGRNKGLCYLPGGERNAPPYWKNCRLDILAIHAEPKTVSAGGDVYSVGFYIGGGKGPRMFKTAGTPGDFFKGLVVMDGKITIGLD